MNVTTIFQLAFPAAETELSADTDYYKGLCYSFGYQVGIDLNKAKEVYLSGAQKGNAKCKYGLATLYLKSKVLSEREEAMILFREAFDKLRNQAVAGDPISQRMISCYYLFGDRGVAREIDTAKTWLTKAAENGDLEAQFNLAHCYETGTAFPMDIKQAFEWYEKAAAQGNEKARRRLNQLKGENNDTVHI